MQYGQYFVTVNEKLLWNNKKSFYDSGFCRCRWSRPDTDSLLKHPPSLPVQGSAVNSKKRQIHDLQNSHGARRCVLHMSRLHQRGGRVRPSADGGRSADSKRLWRRKTGIRPWRWRIQDVKQSKKSILTFRTECTAVGGGGFLRPHVPQF